MNPNDLSDDEIEAIKSYVWRNYPEICRPHDCVPDRESIIHSLPECMRQDLRDCIEGNREPQEAEAGVIMRVVTMLETEKFFQLVDVESLTIARCRECGTILVNDKSQQCLKCGLDWH
jgi:hypothetical protein